MTCLTFTDSLVYFIFTYPSLPAFRQQIFIIIVIQSPKHGIPPVIYCWSCAHWKQDPSEASTEKPKIMFLCIVIQNLGCQGGWLGRSSAPEGGWAQNRLPRSSRSWLMPQPHICLDLCKASLLSRESIAPPSSVPPANLIWAVHPSHWWIHWRELALKLSPAECHYWLATRLV